MSVVLDRYIETTADVRGGRPRIAGTGFTIADLAIRYLELGQPLDEIARKFRYPSPQSTRAWRITTIIARRLMRGSRRTMRSRKPSGARTPH